MIKLKSKQDIELLKIAGKHLGSILSELVKLVGLGVRTTDLDHQARELLKNCGDESSFLNYTPSGSKLAYPAALCVSINEEIVHGIPNKRLIKAGDVVTIDLGLKHQNKYFVDAARTILVPPVDPAVKKLSEAARLGLAAGLQAAKIGNTIGDIGAAVQVYAERGGFGIIRDLSGHGVGFAVHEEPYVPNYGQKGKGEKLKVGMVLAIEPMFTLGGEKTKLLSDGFTFSTKDQSLAVHWEDTVAITEDGPIILTQK
ncbi:MAG: type I methionyl aminopeptidase [Candidatus Vogelbacteria bacterium]|nr:type I methionyl aminopeptidase [Candidatus Vogelbacteria bacterium]